VHWRRRGKPHCHTQRIGTATRAPSSLNSATPSRPGARRAPHDRDRRGTRRTIGAWPRRVGRAVVAPRRPRRCSSARHAARFRRAFATGLHTRAASRAPARRRPLASIGHRRAVATIRRKTAAPTRRASLACRPPRSSAPVQSRAPFRRAASAPALAPAPTCPTTPRRPATPNRCDRVCRETRTRSRDERR